MGLLVRKAADILPHLPTPNHTRSPAEDVHLTEADVLAYGGDLPVALATNRSVTITTGGPRGGSGRGRAGSAAGGWGKLTGAVHLL